MSEYSNRRPPDGNAPRKPGASRPERAHDRRNDLPDAEHDGMFRELGSMSERARREKQQLTTPPYRPAPPPHSRPATSSTPPPAQPAGGLFGDNRYNYGEGATRHPRPRHQDPDEAELRRASLFSHAGSIGPAYHIPGPLALFRDHPIVVGLVSLVIIFSVLSVTRTGNFISGWGPLPSPAGLVAGMAGAMSNSVTDLFASDESRPPGDYRLQAPPSLTAAQVDSILTSYNSPAAGTGAAWVEMGRKYNIDPAFAVAFFVHESTAGTHPGWAGLKPDGSTTHNVGNIICAGYDRCYGRFRDYRSWEEGIEDWYRLIAVEYLEGRNMQTVADIIPVYAPAVENDVGQYVGTVEQLVDGWRMQYGSGPQDMGSMRPFGNPLNDTKTIMTQGYGTGSHAPANVWGAIDLALDGNGDGRADPDGTWDRPIYATHSGVVEISPASWPAGNHIWVANEHYKTGYAHLRGFAVESGQQVERGTVIGYIGSTGQSSGPHLDYQVWERRGSGWVNVNPLDYAALELPGE